ncbi:efflux RND transporter periplasmic adaptor subunit [Dyadobacter sp. CY326]|uniref:efflux RND transporter periplasmic adaptor subunit n=1 Tax=Dyadobacter sp. CY326 TaxID=2907300 RepID=UPI001F41DED9|nr:efflux RND transporter periplasmic adaptor subunit [Dyadobacter sp. CY326]MCE7064234.1 efflux RND transporter periplasmic adaptor subunit [Dyadobacter sp. CY326]
MKRLLIFLAVVAVIGLTAAKLLDNKEKTAEKVYVPEADPKVGVKIAVAEMRKLSQDESFLGSFTPNRKVEIRPQAGGEIVRLNIQEGQFVKAGQLIAKLDDEQLRYQIEALQVTLEGYQNDLKRYEVLVKGDAVPAVNLERTQLSIRSTEAQIKQLKKQISNTSIIAPFSGIVTAKMVEKGSVVSIGTPMAEITDISLLKLVVNIPEKSVNEFRNGKSIAIKTDVYPDANFTGKVTMVSAEGDDAHNYPVEITVQNSQKNPLKAGMYGSIANASEVKGAALAVPRQAITGSAKQPQIYVVENGKANLRDVAIGATTNEYYEITKGLKAGDKVVTSGQINLQNGTSVIAQ